MLRYKLMNYLVIAAVLAWPVAGQRPQPASAERPQTRRGEVSSPLLFIQNNGQWPDAVRFQMRQGNQTWWFTDQAVWVTVVRGTDGTQGTQGTQGTPSVTLSHPVPLSPCLLVSLSPCHLQGINLLITPRGLNPAAHLVPADPQPTRMSYFLGNDPTKWRSNVPTFGSLVWHDVYPGIDLAFGKTWQVILNLQSRAKPCAACPWAPFGAISNLHLRVDGADRLRLDQNGRLVAETPIGDRTLPALVNRNGQLLTVTDGNVVSLSVLSPDSLVTRSPGHPATLSPADDPSDLLYSTFLGGSVDDLGYGVAVDASGAAYVVGGTDSRDFPTTPGAFERYHISHYDAFVSKFDPTGSTLLYSTYLGGGADDCRGNCLVAVDANGAAYVSGSTASRNFPTTPDAFQPSSGGGATDVFVTKLDPSGASLVYSTYLGGIAAEDARGIALTADEEAYITGETTSRDFPTTPGAFQTVCHGQQCGDAFIIRLNAAGTALLYSTYLGGSDGDQDNGAGALAVDASGAAYITGATRSLDFPVTAGAFDTSYNGGGCCRGDAFLAKLSADGSRVLYATYLGSSSNDSAFGIAVDAQGATYVVGSTTSTDFPTTPGAYDTTYNGRIGCCTGDMFITKVSPDGSALVYSTYLGGSGDECDGKCQIILDEDGAAIVTSESGSSDYPTTPGAYDNIADGTVIVTKLNRTGSALLYSTYLAGAEGRYSSALTMDLQGAVYVTSNTNSSDFRTTPGAFDRSFNGDGGEHYGDAFVLKLNVTDSLLRVASIDPSYTPLGNSYRIGTVLQIQDLIGAPIPGAVVTLRVTEPNGHSITASVRTNLHGNALAAGISSQTGTYSFTVVAVSKPGWLYDPAQNVETSDSITIP